MPRDIQSIVWRKDGRSTRSEEWKQRLTTYNLEDCAALKRVTELVYAVIAQVQSPAQTGTTSRSMDLPVVRVQDIERWANNRNFGNVNFVHADYRI